LVVEKREARAQHLIPCAAAQLKYPSSHSSPSVIK
jgi:hypothetical protein